MENLKRKEHIAWKDLGDHVIILDSGEGKMVHHLEDVSSLIWKLLDGSNSNEDIIKSITDNYETDIEVAKKDMNTFIAKLHDNNLLDK